MSTIILSARQQFYLRYFKPYQKLGISKAPTTVRVATLVTRGGQDCKFECIQCGEYFRQVRGLGRDDKLIRRHLQVAHGIEVPQFGGTKTYKKPLQLSRGEKNRLRKVPPTSDPDDGSLGPLPTAAGAGSGAGVTGAGGAGGATLGARALAILSGGSGGTGGHGCDGEEQENSRPVSMTIKEPVDQPDSRLTLREAKHVGAASIVGEMFGDSEATRTLTGIKNSSSGGGGGSTSSPLSGQSLEMQLAGPRATHDCIVNESNAPIPHTLIRPTDSEVGGIHQQTITVLEHGLTRDHDQKQ